MNDTQAHEPAAPASEPRQFAGVEIAWLLIGVVMFTIAAAVAYRPSFDTPLDVAAAIAQWPLLAGMIAVLAQHRLGLSRTVVTVAILVVVGCWLIVVLDDSNWSILVFALYPVCYMAFADDGPAIGLALAFSVSAAWAVSHLIDDAPRWLVAIPFIAFAGGAAIALEMHRSAEINEAQAELIDQLHATRRELAASERSKGVLEERARVAGEIHDTLAQGFTSIVLLSRAARRSGGGAAEFSEIEETAQENLDAARRLVTAASPPELERASLCEALDRHLSSDLPDSISGRFRVVGEPRRLRGDVEVTLLRAAQEALANVTAHSQAQHVDVTISYLDDTVALDVRDDGVGFVDGQVADRGSLTGGQGLDALKRRAQSLAGTLTIETDEGRGSVISVLLPTGAA